jgi:membrane protease YdiL (CAAX protease family)
MPPNADSTLDEVYELPSRGLTEVRDPPWRMRDALLAYVVGVTVPNALFAALYLAGVQVSIGPGVLCIEAVLIVTMLYFTRRRGPVSLRDFGVRTTYARAAVGWVVLALLATAVLSALYALAANPSVPVDPLRDAHAQGVLAIGILGLSAVFAAPVTEELFFRGFLYRAFRSTLPLVPAVLLDGILFAAFHFPGQHLDVLPQLAIAGIIFCLLYERTGSLLPGIALHSFTDASFFEAAVTDRGALVTTLCFLTLALVMLLAPWRWWPNVQAGRPRTAG